MSSAKISLRRSVATALLSFSGRWLAAFAMWIASMSTVSTVRATTVQPPEFAELVEKSDFVVRAVVKSVTAEFAAPGSRKIVTKVELEVREVIAGEPPTPLVLTMLGGKVGDTELVVDGAPRFQVGDEDVLFVRGNGKQFYPLTAIMHGRYPVLAEANSGRKYVARSNLVPLEDTAEVALPMTDGAAATMQQRLKTPARALTPEQFSSQIKAAAKAKKTSSTGEKLK